MGTRLENLTAEQKANGTPEDKIIIIKSIFSKEAKLKLQPTKNQRNGRYLGIETNLSEMEKMKRGYTPEVSSSITLKDGYSFNLDDPQDAADWEWVQHSIHVAEDFEAAQRSERAWYYIFRPGVESKKKLNDMSVELGIMNKIMEDTETNLYNRVRLMGIDMSDQPLSDVKEYLMSAAKDRSRRAAIIDLYENANVSLKLMLYHGMDKEVIVFDGFAYRYGTILLGTTEPLALDYLGNSLNVAIVKEMENAIYPKAAAPNDNLAKARAAKKAKAEQEKLDAAKGKEK